MRKTFILIVLAMCCSMAALAGDKFGREIVACGDNQALIIRPATSTEGQPDVVWRWHVSDAQGQVPDAFLKHMVPLDDCKPVDNNRKLLLTSSGGGIVVLDRATRRVLFHAHVPMAHSAEWLPGGKIAVALSTAAGGNSIELYDLRQSDRPLFRDSLYSGHGVVWVKSSKLLYALGYDELRAYQLVDIKTDHPSLKLVDKWGFPGISGHDLTPIDNRHLLMTNAKGVFQFDMDTHTFTPFPPMSGWKDVKSANYDVRTGQLIYTKAEISWWTHHIYSMNPQWTLTFDDINLYKVRVMR